MNVCSMVNFIFPAEMMPDIISSARRLTTSPRCRLRSMMCRPSSCTTSGGELSRKEIWTCPRGNWKSQVRKAELCFAGARKGLPQCVPSRQSGCHRAQTHLRRRAMFSARTALASGVVAKPGQDVEYRDDSKLCRVRDQRDRVLEICLCSALSASPSSGGLCLHVLLWMSACSGRSLHVLGAVAVSLCLLRLRSRPLNLRLGRFVIGSSLSADPGFGFVPLFRGFNWASE